MGNAESREFATGSFQHNLNDDKSSPLSPKNASTRYSHRQKLRGSSARNSTRGTQRSNSSGHGLGTPALDESILDGRLSAGNGSFLEHARSKKSSRRPKGSRSESPITKRRRHERGLESGTAHYFTGSHAMTSPISPPQKRSVGARTANNRAINDTMKQSSVSHGSRSDPLPRVPQYDQKTNLAWPPGRSPPTCPRSMRSTSIMSACNISELLGTAVKASDSNAGEGIAHASFGVNGGRVYINSKATDLDETTARSSAALAGSSTVSSLKMKRCHSCPKPQNTDERPLWIRCADCKHKNHWLCCKSEGAGNQVVQDQGSASQREAMCSRCTAKTMKLTLVNNDGYDSLHSQEHPPKRRKTEEDAAKDVIDGRNSPSQTVQSYHGNALYTSGTGTSLTANQSGKHMQIDSETLDLSNRDALLEDIGQPSPNGVQLAESRNSFVKAPGSAETSVKGEQQKLDLNVQVLGETPACTRITENNVREVLQDSSQAPSPRAPGSINQENPDKDTYHLRFLARFPTRSSGENKEDKVEGSPTQSVKAGNGISNTGSVLPSSNTLSKDSVVSFPLCTSCGTKRMFNIPTNGETDILCKTCASAKRSFDATTLSQGDPLEDLVNLQIPETPATNRSSQQNVSPGLEGHSETIDGSSNSVNGLRDVDKPERWPFGSKLKSAVTIHRSGGVPVLNQVPESPLTSRPNGPARSDISEQKDPDVCPPETLLTAHAPSSASITVPPVVLDLPLQDRMECEPEPGDVLREVEEGILANTKTIVDLKWRLKKALTMLGDQNKTLNLSAKSLTDKHQKAIQVKEQEVQQVKAELELVQSKVESAKAVLSEDLNVSTAKDEITSLRSQLAVRDQDQGDSSKELTRLRTEVRALKERLHSSAKSAIVVPNFIHTNLFDAAPELRAENVFFDAEAKKKEIEKRPSRKQTFGRRLIHIRRERGQYPHREVYRHSPKPCEIYRDANICLIEEPTGTMPAKRRELQDLGPGEVLEEDVHSGKGEEKGPTSLEELMGVPRNAIPCLVEGQLAYRECTRDAKGRLPRAKATYKVGRNVAGQLK